MSKKGKYDSYTGKMCTHSGVTELVLQEKPRLVVYAGAARQFESSGQHFDFLIDCCRTRIKSYVSLSSAAKHLLNPTKYPTFFCEDVPTISIDWPDGGSPPVSFRFWKDVFTLIKSGKRVGIYCFGGHGRTGTGLAMIFHSAGWSGDLVSHVREVYCKCAVESDSQITYLKAAGIKTEAKPSKTPFIPSPSHGAGTIYDDRKSISTVMSYNAQTKNYDKVEVDSRGFEIFPEEKKECAVCKAWLIKDENSICLPCRLKIEAKEGKGSIVS